MIELVLTCEHAGNRVPARYRALFAGCQELTGHRGYDPGAWALARHLACATGAPLIASQVTRLLVEPNRSASHPRVFSRLTRPLPAAERAALLARYHEPHRRRVEETVRERTAGGAVVLHLGVHTFTPNLDGDERAIDLALLYDPGRQPEARLARRWLGDLRSRLPGLRIRANAPYRGVSDGLTTALRRRFPARRYLGIELEVNQGYFEPAGGILDRPHRRQWPEVRSALTASLVEILGCQDG